MTAGSAKPISDAERPARLPGHFSSIETARQQCQAVSGWHDDEHLNSVWACTAQLTFTAASPPRSGTNALVCSPSAYAVHPERLVHKPPQPPALPDQVGINKPDNSEVDTPVQGAQRCLRQVDSFRPERLSKRELHRLDPLSGGDSVRPTLASAGARLSDGLSGPRCRRSDSTRRPPYPVLTFSVEPHRQSLALQTLAPQWVSQTPGCGNLRCQARLPDTHASARRLDVAAMATLRPQLL